MNKRKRTRLTIIDGAPQYRHESTYTELVELVESCHKKATKAYCVFAQASRQNPHAILEALRSLTCSFANAPRLLQLQMERIYRAQLNIVSVDNLKPDPYVDYDGSPEHKAIVSECSTNGSYLAIDVLTLTFLLNNLFQDGIAIAMVIAGQGANYRHFDFDDAIEFLVKNIDSLNLSGLSGDSFLSDLCWLDANLRLPCQLVYKTRWQTYICGYRASLSLDGTMWRKYGRNNRYEVLHRRYWPKFHSCYDSAKYLAEEFAKPPNYFQRSKILKAIALFGLAPADIFDITTRLTKFVLSLLQVLDIENPEYYTQ